MSDSPSGLLARVGPLRFLTGIVVLAFLLVFMNNRSADSPAPEEIAAEDTTVTTPVGTADTGAFAQTEVDSPDAPAGSGTPIAEAIQDLSSGEGATVSADQTTAPETVAPADTGTDVSAEGLQTSGAVDQPTPMAADAAAAGETAPVPPAESADETGCVVGETSLRLMDTVRQTLGDGGGVLTAAGEVSDGVKTHLIGLVDSMVQDQSLVLGIATPLDDTFGILSFPGAERQALAVRQFFLDQGIDAGRIVAGVLVPDYEPDDGVQRRVSFFVAERR
jgi:hypothetical protein